MTNKLKYILPIIILLISVKGYAQNTTNSPYSQFGLGDIKPALTPQNLGMGGVAMGIKRPGGYNNINIANPASYSAISLTTFDIGASLDFRTLSKGDLSQKTTNGTLSHFLMAIPVNKKSALSFGLMPYSDLGYQYRIHTTVGADKVDHIYSGEGGLARAHVGYGYQIAPKLNLGFNLAYIMGDLKTKQSTEFPEDGLALSSRVQTDKNVGGVSLQYGLQYVVNPEAKHKLIIGYSGTLPSKLKTSGSDVTFRYRFDPTLKTESEPIDTIYYNPAASSRMRIPQTNTIGFALENTDHWVFGADFTYTRWSKFSDGNSNQGLKDSYGLALGGQFTPDVTAVSHYFRLVDYSFGLKYDKTYINIGGQNINQYALCFGLGLPLPSNRTTFYKINFSAEMGKRGTLKNNLVRENYLNVHLGFVINDRWFIKAKYD